MTSILIGHRVQALLLPLSLLICAGCWNVVEPNRYDAYVVNQTSEAFNILNNQTRDTTSGGYILPGESFYFSGQPGLSDEDDPVEDFLNSLVNFQSTVEIIREDSVLVTWQGPARAMGEGVNHFYNYDAWEVSFERNEFDEGIYTLKFFITESDLQP
ncbi:MAG TPA: hypothetical protein DCR93_34045 [Cytophagales bacterium]|nr:hypothetical protein [Cytophagales bacterium]HAP64295.1 hypothetical protein [Cytophagales bacterium]